MFSSQSKVGLIVIKRFALSKIVGGVALGTGFIGKFGTKLLFVNIIMTSNTELFITIFKTELLLTFNFVATVAGESLVLTL